MDRNCEVGKSKENVRRWQEYQNLVKEEITLNDIINKHQETSIESLKKAIIEYYRSKLTIKETCDFNSRLLGISHNQNPTNAVLVENTEKELLEVFDPLNKFFFQFRNNENLILNLIENVTKSDEVDDLVNLLCHFFYDNILIQNPEREEILHIIYLLLEKEIANLKTPSVSSFLDGSFIGKLLKSLTRRQEIKQYLSMILGDLILQMEKSTENFLEVDPMRIYDRIKHKKTPEGYKNNNLKKVFDVDKKMILGDRIRKTTITRKHLSRSNEKQEFDYEDEMLQLKHATSVNCEFLRQESMKQESIDLESTNTQSEAEVNMDYLIDLTEDELRFRFENEANQHMKEYYFRLLSRIDEDKNMYTNQKFLDHLSAYSSDPFKVLSIYKRNFEQIKFFIDKLFNNLIENDSIIPYVIKCICKIIGVLITKKFPNIGHNDKNSFIGEFVFGKLIMPILTNPDYNGIISSSVISINTRKNLCNINQILRKISKATFFDSTREVNFTIFNTYLIEIMPMILGFFDKLNEVKLPQRIEEKLYDNNNSHQYAPYNYFNENNDQLVNIQSVCFSIQDLLIFIKTVKSNFDFFSTENSIKRSIEKIDYQENFLQNKIKEGAVQNVKQYFVIFNTVYNPSKVDMLYPKQNRFTLTNTSDTLDHEFTLVRVKYCMKTILRSLNVINSGVYSHLSDCNSTQKLFYALNKIIQLEDYSDSSTNDKVPLNWYSLYLNSNSMFLKEEYRSDNYNALYEEMMSEATKEIELLNYKSNLMITKYGMNLRCAETISELIRKDMFKVKQVEKFIRVEKFIESAKIQVCVRSRTTKENSNEGSCSIIVVKPDQCIHQRLHQLERQFEGKVEKHEGHCDTIHEFIHLFQTFKEVKEDVINGDQGNKSYETLDDYLTIVKEHMTKHHLFNNIYNEENICLALEDIENYILDRIYKKVFPEKELPKDSQFHEHCVKLQWVSPLHLEINKKFINENLWLIAIAHLNRMDIEKSPVSKLKCVQAAYKIINNCINFCSGKDEGAGVDDIIPILIHVIIRAQLKRVFSNVQFIKTFMNPGKLLATYGFLLTQVEMAIEFILGISHSVLRISEEEFNK